MAFSSNDTLLTSFAEMMRWQVGRSASWKLRSCCVWIEVYIEG